MEIVGAEKLVSVYGEWPSFHDAEVLSVKLDRTDRDCFAEIDIYLFASGPEVDEQGYFKIFNKRRVTLRFDGIDDFKAADFFHQNVISQLNHTFENGWFSVQLDSSLGFETSFSCSRIEVVRVEEWNSKK